MTLGLRDTRTRRRRQFRWRIIKTLLFLAAAIGAGVVAYQGGSLLARQEVLQLEKQVTELENDVIALQRQSDDLLAEAQDAKRMESEWRSRYEAEVPQGEVLGLFQALQKKLADGVEVERLAFVVDEARSLQDCEEETATKRFIVQTPYSGSGNDSISFDRKTVTVTAAGEPATDAAGNPQGWFDPAKPVTTRFTEIGGRNSESQGMLPQHHAMVIGDKEYRFTVLQGERGFVTVTRERCAYP
ncbi:MAG: hypothetical protein AAF495_28490 [Pseudomonadota bacterium]